MGISEKEELRDRVEAKRKELEAKLSEAKASGRREGREGTEQLEERLGELKETLAGGWDQLTEGVASKLNDWLSKDADKA